MYKNIIATKLYSYQCIFYWIDKCFDFTLQESLTIKSYLVEEISYVFSHTIDYRLPFDTPNQKYVKIHNYIKCIFFHSFEITPISYRNRKMNYNCLRTSIVPSEIGSAWVLMLQRNYVVTLFILSYLDRLYRTTFKELRPLFIKQLHEYNILDNAINWFGFDRTEISKLYRMKLLLEKYDQLHKIINFTKI